MKGRLTDKNLNLRYVDICIVFLGFVHFLPAALTGALCPGPGQGCRYRSGYMWRAQQFTSCVSGYVGSRGPARLFLFTAGERWGIQTQNAYFPGLFSRTDLNYISSLCLRWCNETHERAILMRKKRLGWGGGDEVPCPLSWKEKRRKDNSFKQMRTCDACCPRRTLPWLCERVWPI